MRRPTRSGASSPLSANLTLQHSVVLAGEGIALYQLKKERIGMATLADRDPRADPIEVYVDESGFTALARGAAAIAIQRAFDEFTWGDDE